MSEKKPKASLVDTAATALTTAMEDLTFHPSVEMRRIKATFWATQLENPTCAPDKVTASDVAAITGDSRISRWWAVPGFKDWLRNKDEWRQRQEYLCSLAQDTAEQILLDPHANANAKVQLIKFLTESVGKAEARVKETKMLDAEIHKMSPEQLESYIERHTAKKA